MDTCSPMKQRLAAGWYPNKKRGQKAPFDFVLRRNNYRFIASKNFAFVFVS